MLDGFRVRYASLTAVLNDLQGANGELAEKRGQGGTERNGLTASAKAIKVICRTAGF